MDSFEETRGLVAAARNGAAQPLALLVARYGRQLRAHTRALMGDGLRDEADSQDLVQELFLDLVRDFEAERFDSEADFLRWARHVARNNVRDLARRARLRRPLCGGHTDSRVEPLGPSEDQPSRQAERGEAVEGLWEELERMSHEERTTLELRETQQLSWEEIARRTGRPSADAARIFHARALTRLATKLSGRNSGTT